MAEEARGAVRVLRKSRQVNSFGEGGEMVPRFF